ncbi:MAG: hypothetical protein ABIM46_03220, partial [candidate division WOR-3 bacterium]
DWPNSIIQTTDGGYVVAGVTYSFGAGYYDCFVLKLNPDGSLAWARTYGSTGWDEARSIIQTTDGGYAVAGFTESFGAGRRDFLILKLNSDGSLVWARTFGGTNSEEAYSIIEAADGGYAVVGATQSFGAGDLDFLVLKLGSDGSYEGCVQDCSPTLYDVSPASSFLFEVGNCPMSTSSMSPTVTAPNLTITDACVPLFVEESSLYSESGITCSPLPAGALFISPEEMLVRIYKADGKLAYSGELRKGKNRINLDAGVYFWHAGQFKGKAVVR